MKTGDLVKVSEEAQRYVTCTGPITEAVVQRRIGGPSSEWYMIHMRFGLDTQVAILPNYLLKKVENNSIV